MNKERNLELLRHNDAEKILKEDQLRAERERDKDMLNRAISREKEIERIENEERQRRRQEVIELQKFYMEKAEDKKAED